METVSGRSHQRICLPVHPPSLPHRAHLGRATVGRQPGGKAERRERMQVGLCLPLGPTFRGRLGPSASARGPHGRARPCGFRPPEPRTPRGGPARVLWSWMLVHGLEARSSPGSLPDAVSSAVPSARLLLAALLVQAQGAPAVSQGRRRQGGRGVNV
ncbi:unnamed protein product [Rangifer tarandus platyrhynchus]|uniref:Uncharacterized protein n=1 Tax=Rangifer tarandus platyrhynchus TaxID=3082113 RepID=A0ABN9A1B6_RANTA|nr:unnamed protein product [Rangifer tarandus platyrhynchus]